jgi:hypothetical protein
MLDEVVATSLREFESFLVSADWHGKEHDCVNLFVHAFLFRHVCKGGAIEDFTQIGIEIGVPQPDGIGKKDSVRKDLVIWDTPRAVAWDKKWRPVRHPRSIIEWKARHKTRLPALDPYDIDWLQRYSLHYPDFTGYAVTVNLASESRRITTARIHAGEVFTDFHKV